MMSVRHSRLSSCTFYGGGGCVCSIHDHMSVQTWGGELRECSNVNEQHNTAPDKATPDLPWVQAKYRNLPGQISGQIFHDRFRETSKNDGLGELPRTTTSDRPRPRVQTYTSHFPGYRYPAVYETRRISRRKKTVNQWGVTE